MITLIIDHPSNPSSLSILTTLVTHNTLVKNPDDPNRPAVITPRKTTLHGPLIKRWAYVCYVMVMFLIAAATVADRGHGSKGLRRHAANKYRLFKVMALSLLLLLIPISIPSQIFDVKFAFWIIAICVYFGLVGWGTYRYFRLKKFWFMENKRLLERALAKPLDTWNERDVDGWANAAEIWEPVEIALSEDQKNLLVDIMAKGEVDGLKLASVVGKTPHDVKRELKLPLDLARIVEMAVRYKMEKGASKEGSQQKKGGGGLEAAEQAEENSEEEREFLLREKETVALERDLELEKGALQ